MNNTVNLNVNELQDFLTHIITNNKQLQEKGKNMVSTEVVGESGIGKTSSIKELADNLNLDFVKINLAQIDEVGDLVGFPTRQFQMAKKDEKSGNWTTKWADEQLVEDYKKKGYQSTGKSQMGHCVPKWIANKKDGGILLLDDWNRAEVRFIQAVMELIDRQEYISWTLPKNWHIILTANPDNGDYLVNSIDSAQKTRFISANLEFNADVWAKWAENAEIDGRCINFLLMHPELVTQETNARAITTYFNAISSFEKFEENLPMIQMIGEGSVGTEFSTMFTTFINNKLDKLVTPETMLCHENDQHVRTSLKEAIGVDNAYRADVAAVLCTRLANYALHFSKNNSVTQSIINRLIMLSTEEIFANDLKYFAIREILNGNKQKFQKLMMNADVVKMATK